MRLPLSRCAAACLVTALAAMNAAAVTSNNPLGSYDFAPTAVEGSARRVGLAGSIVAFPSDYSATFVNPAGLGGLAGDGVDFGSDSNHIDNLIVNVDDPKSKAIDDPINFSFLGFRYVTDKGWGWGFSVQTPYALDSIFSGTAKVKKGSKIAGQDLTEIQAASHLYTVGGAKSFLDNRLSVGLAVNYIQVAESYDFTPVFSSTAPIHRAATSDAFSADLGFLGKPWPWLRIGATYKMGYRAAFDPNRNQDTVGTTGFVAAFRDGKAPDRVALGLAWTPNRYLRVFAQSNYTLKMRDTVVVGSGLFPGNANVLTVGQGDTLDGHWGAELVPIDEPDLTIKFWAGGYYEVTGLQGGYNRYHRTAGLGFNPWCVSTSLAVDDAEFYNNFTIGVGVDMLEVADRIAKKYGWKLPL